MSNPFKQKKAAKKPRVVGTVRQNQLINTFGVGSIVDFVKDTVMVAGVDDWDSQDESRHIYNENLQSLTGAKYFVKPKTEGSAFWWNKSRDIPSFIFPEKLYCPKCKSLIDARELQFLDNPHKCFLNIKDKPCNGQLVASRFVVICENGHIEDFPYSWWVHVGMPCSSTKDDPRIRMYNVDNRSDIDSLILECADCGLKRLMSGAFQEYAFSGDNGYHCNNNHPHIEGYHIKNEEPCTALLKTRLRSSSGVYFPVSQSALSIPPWSKRSVQIILGSFDALKFMDEENAKSFITQSLLPKAKRPIIFDDLLKAYYDVRDRKQDSMIRSEADIYHDEYSVLCRGTVEGDDEYSAFEVPCPKPFDDYFEKVVVIDKLTVIQAICGFTRGKPWSGQDLSDIRIVPLSSEKKDWLPAAQMNGEGIFIKFDTVTVRNWMSGVKDRYHQLQTAYEDSYLYNARFSPEYVLLHTFSHLFIRQLANECGYGAASLKEKIYCTFNDRKENGAQMLGVLIYLASSDCDGSLGGLISIAQDTEQLKSILMSMLQKALWCSADPLCISSTQQGFASLNYAACHDCVLLPETSCEFRNVLLDRVSIVGKPENRGLGFMGELAQSL